MSSIATYLNQILRSVYGKDVRQAIHDAISECYDDVNAPALQTEAMQAAVQAKIDAGEMAALTIADGSLTGAKLANGTISTAKIADGAITAAKIASGVVPAVDATLTQPGAAADAKAVGDAIASITPGLSDDAKTALLNCFAHVAWTDAYGQEYYDDLAEALDHQPQPIENTTAKIDIHNQICGTEGVYKTVTGAGITIFYVLGAPSVKLHVAGILPYAVAAMQGTPNASLQVYNGTNFVNFVNEVSGSAQSSNRWLRWATGALVHTEYEATYDVNTYDRIRFCVDENYLDDSYMYDVETGQVFFAGVNTPYYGMSNISEAS